MSVTTIRTMNPPRLGNPRHSPVTMALIAVNVAVFLAEIAYPPLVVQLGEIPRQVAIGEYYRLLTSAFIHQPLPHVAHILTNMWTLWVFGHHAERTLGRGRYLVLYLLSALGGSALTYVFLPPQTNGIGASGAIFGLLGALIVLGKRTKLDLGWLLGTLLINLVSSFTVANINWYAHLGGLAAGALIASTMRLPSGRRRELAGVAMSVLVTGAAVGSIAYQTTALQAWLRGLGGTYAVTVTQSACTGLPQCANGRTARMVWTIGGCDDHRCTITGPLWAGAQMLTLTNGHWTMTAQRTAQQSSRCQGVPAPTIDVVDLTSRVVDGVETLHGTMRASTSRWRCRPLEQDWQVTGTR